MSANFSLIIEAEELYRNLDNPDWVIVDCRFNLLDPGWGEKEYEALHIPNAVYADLNRDLSGEKTAFSGRHPLPDAEKIQQVFSSLGISSLKQVVVYDTTGGSFAARLWFMLKLYGHANVAVLDGGFTFWHAQGYPFESGHRMNTREEFNGINHPELYVTTPMVEKRIHDPEWRVIDARAHERYAGIVEPIDPVAGHIPGALNRFHELNLTPEGLFKPAEQLRAEFTPLIDLAHPEKTIVYCGSGVTSAHHLIAMQLAGFPPPKLYIGSWSEWIRDPNRPVVHSETP